MHADYCRFLLVDDLDFDTEMVSNVVDSLKSGKASIIYLTVLSSVTSCLYLKLETTEQKRCFVTILEALPSVLSCRKYLNTVC